MNVATTNSLYKDKFYKTVLIITYLFVLFYAITYANEDAYNLNMRWGVDFFSILKQGNILHFYQMEGKTGVYNILIILIFAIWMLPFNIICKLIGYSLADGNVEIYTIWYKMLFLLALYVSVHYFEKILRKLSFDEEKIWLGKILFLISPFTLIGNIGWGQIDILPLMFFLIGMYYCLENERLKMVIYFSISGAFKWHTLFLIVPLILYIEKDIIKLVKSYIMCLIAPFVVEIASRFDPYYVINKNSTGAYLEDILSAYVNHTSIYIVCFVLLCLFCYFIKYDEKQIHLFIPPFLSFTIFMFLVGWHSQWGIYILPALVVLLLNIKDDVVSIILNLGVGFGYILYHVSLWMITGDNHMVDHGIFKLILGRSEPYVGVPLASRLPLRDSYGKSLLIPCLVFIAIITIFESRLSSYHQDVKVKNGAKVYSIVAFLPGMVFAGATVLLYFLNI